MSAQADVRLGDCLEGLRSLPDETIDLFVTSPPFNVGGKFHTSYQDGTMIQYGDYGVCKDNLPEDQYQEWQLAVLGEMWRTLRSGGSAFYQHKVRIKGGKAIHPLEWIFRSPFILKQEITLRFPGTVNNDKVRFLPFSERLYWLTKSTDTKLLDPRCSTYSDVWDIQHTNRQAKGHPAGFDKLLPQRCILASSHKGELVCDPFTGSGTTVVEAISLGRRFIGWEIDPKYHARALHNLSKVQATLLAEL